MSIALVLSGRPLALHHMPGSLVLDTEFNVRPFRLISAGFVKLDMHGVPRLKQSFLVVPDGFTIDEHGPAYHVHRITNAWARTHGVSILCLLGWLQKILPTCSQIVGHNVKRDVVLLREEADRYQVHEVSKMLARLPQADTLHMARSQGLCKPLTLGHVYCQLFGQQEMAGAHDAFEDALGTARVFSQLRRNSKVKPAGTQAYIDAFVCK